MIYWRSDALVIIIHSVKKIEIKIRIIIKIEIISFLGLQIYLNIIFIFGWLDRCAWRI